MHLLALTSFQKVLDEILRKATTMALVHAHHVHISFRTPSPAKKQNIDGGGVGNK